MYGKTRSKILRWGMTLTIAAALGAATALPAAAAPPQREGTFTFDMSGTDPCDGFDLVSSGTLTVRVTVFFDSAGDAIKVQIHASRDQILTNSVSGKSLALRGHALVVIDLTTGWETWVGQVIQSNERGVGSVLQDTGRLVFDENFDVRFLAGPHDGITNPEKFCGALA